MPTSDLIRYVAALARTVDQLRRSKEAGEPQKAALRALVDISAERSVTLRFYDQVLTVDGEPIATSDARLAPFPERLAAQSVAEIVIARGAEPSELLALATGLAAEPGRGRIKERLRDAASTRVMVVSAAALDAPLRTMSISGAFEKVKLDEAVLKEWNKFLDHGGNAASTDKQVDLGLRAESTGELQVDVGAVMQGAPAAAPTDASRAVPPPAPPAPPASPAPPAPAPLPPLEGAAPPPTPSSAPPQPPAAPAPKLAQPATLQATTPLGIAVAKLLSDPFGADTLAKLTVLSRQLQDAFTQDRVAEAIDVSNTLIELEQRAVGPVRGTYGVILRRTLTRSVLTQVAPYLLEPRRRSRAMVVLKRGAEESSALLTGLFAAAQSIGERMTYLEVLRSIPNGLDRVLELLSRSEWQVMRNTAEAMGEARVEESVQYLARLVEHADERVRRAATVALARIGSVATLEPLRNALKNGTPELKAQILNSIGGAHARPLTAPLAVLADQEENPELIRACYKAIGRIGTPEAKQALERAAAQKSLFSRRAKVAREAAEDVLKTFGTG